MKYALAKELRDAGFPQLPCQEFAADPENPEKIVVAPPRGGGAPPAARAAVAAGPAGAAERPALSPAERVLLRALLRDLGRLQRDAEALRLALLPYLIDMARLEAERELRAAEG